MKSKFSVAKYLFEESKALKWKTKFCGVRKIKSNMFWLDLEFDSREIRVFS